MNTPPRVLDLFSGIGGFALGLERAGFETIAFCETDGYARRVLRKHWPHAWLYDDVRAITAKRLRADGNLPIDLVCGGFPCQDISTAGKGAGLDGARSGLWSEMLRVVKETRPRWVVAENVPALRGRGADRVLADLEGAGYAVRPVVVGAWAVGGAHRRDRVWVVANSDLPGDRVRRAFDPMGEAPCPRTESRFAQPEPPRMADGVPRRLDRLRCLGNAVVPLIPELIGRWIIEADPTLSRTEPAA